MAKSNPPSIKETAFDCPHCGAYAAQQWINLHAKYREASNKTPFVPNEKIIQQVKESKIPRDRKEKFLTHLKKLQAGLICFERQEQGKYLYDDVHNLSLSQCFNCEKFSVWVHDRLVHPTAGAAPPANQDLPQDVLQDYEEAGRIMNESPRGAAALLRLAIQKICVFLGEKGNAIDADIASLVKKGLNSTIQKALDAVRVIGNEAVHPGTLNLKDDRATASKLFKLVNIIAEQMISNPKHVNELYGQIPEAKRKAIENRDGG